MRRDIEREIAERTERRSQLLDAKAIFLKELKDFKGGAWSLKDLKNHIFKLQKEIDKLTRQIESRQQLHFSFFERKK